MLQIDIAECLNILGKTELVKLPYGNAPIKPRGSNPHGNSFQFSEEEWNAWHWPTLGRRYRADDTNATEKPSWETLVAIHYESLRERLRPLIIAECRRRITRAYGELNETDEIFKRLRGGHTAEQDIERDRLRAVAQAQIASLESMTAEQLLAYNHEKDDVWNQSPPDETS